MKKSITKLGKKKEKLSVQTPSVIFSEDGLRDSQRISSEDSMTKARSMPNFFGLPPYATPSTPLGIVYMSRGASSFRDSEAENIGNVELEELDGSMNSIDIGFSGESTQSKSNQAAQKKVAQSLLSMATAPSTVSYFMNKGGVEAVIRLIQENTDSGVLHTCSTCLKQAAISVDNCKILIDKRILSAVTSLVEKGDSQIKFECAVILSHLSMVSGISEENLVMGGIIGVVQLLISTADRIDVICFSLLSICNVATSLYAGEAETAVRVCIHTAKKIDVTHNVSMALFMSNVLATLSSVPQFSSILCEESATPLLLHLIEAHPLPNIINFCSIAFLNLSLNRKNRREMGSSGIANLLEKIFLIGDADAIARMLTTIGNLLNSGYFFDKIAREDIINVIVNRLYELSRSGSSQFVAVSYCVSQLATNDACAELLVKCQVFKRTVRFLGDAPLEAKSYMWSLLVGISHQARFFSVCIGEKDVLFPTILTELFRCEDSRVESIALLAYNISIRSELVKHVSVDQVESLVKSLKLIFAKYHSLRSVVIVALVTIAKNIPDSRSFILADDLIRLLSVCEESEVAINIQCAALLNLISCQENCCLALHDAGAQIFLCV